MKKIVALLLAVLMMVSVFAACAEKPEPTPDTPSTPVTPDAPDAPETPNTDEKSEGVMTYDEYVAAALDSQVVIETYVQAKQSWWEDKATVYTQDQDGAYFLYNMACSEEDFAKLEKGTKIRVTGYKAEWSGEVEIVDATFEILEGSYVAEAVDATAWLGTEELAKHQNELVSFDAMTVVASYDADGNAVPFLYNWDGSGQDGNDLYFNVALNGEVYTFCVESYLCDKSTEVYAAVKTLEIGDVIDLEGFLYWYEGPQPHVTAVKAAEDPKSEGVMTYAEYAAAAVDAPVVVETYVQAKQSWWDNKATVYTQDYDGAYFLYSMACSEEDFAKLEKGTKIRVTGYKAEWSGEVEIVDATFEILEGSYVAPAVTANSWLGTDELVKHQNELVAFKGMTVAASKDADGNDVAFLYSWDGSGQDGSDLYFNVELDGNVYTFCVESYLCDNTTEVYAAVKALNIGDVIDVEGFLYWYEGPQPHVVSVSN